MACLSKTAEHKGGASLFARRLDQDAELTLARGEVDTLRYRPTLYGMDIGRATGPTVSDRYIGPFAFTGEMHWLAYELGNDREDIAKAAQVAPQNQLADR